MNDEMSEEGKSILTGAQQALEYGRQEKWDRFFLKLAEHISTASKDPSTKCGAVIVRPDRTICSVGYNGFPRYMSDSNKRYMERQDKLSRIIHCEMNALMGSKDQSVAGYILYTWPFLSCDRCAVHMIQAGIARAVAPKLDCHLKLADWCIKWRRTLEITRDYYDECGVEVMEYE